MVYRFTCLVCMLYTAAAPCVRPFESHENTVWTLHGSSETLLQMLACRVSAVWHDSLRAPFRRVDIDIGCSVRHAIAANPAHPLHPLQALMQTLADRAHKTVWKSSVGVDT